MLALNDEKHDKLIHQKFFIVPKDGARTYRLVASSYDEGGTGAYRLAVYEASRFDIVEFHLKNLSTEPPEQQPKILEDFMQILKDKGDAVSLAEAGLAQRALSAFELQTYQAGKPATAKPAAAMYDRFGKILLQSREHGIREAAKNLAGAARRLDLTGKPLVLNGTTLAGKPFDRSAYKGKVVLVDVWASWCVPCVEELPNIRKLYDVYKARGFEVVGINRDQNADIAAKFMEKHSLPWTCLFDARGEGGEAFVEYYGMFTLPQTILVGREGRVVSLRARGEELGRLLEQLLGPVR